MDADFLRQDVYLSLYLDYGMDADFLSQDLYLGYGCFADFNISSPPKDDLTCQN